jgi:ubiquitin
MFNNKMYDYYKKKQLYPISLKQLVTDKPSVDFTNEPGKAKKAAYNIQIAKFNCNISAEGKEIGLFTFKNTDTTKQISLQVRGFPHKYTTAQTEITSDGTPSGGRLGKIPVDVLDRVMEEFGDERIKSINYFGRSPKLFSAFDKKRIDEVYAMYKKVSSHTKVQDGNKLTKAAFNDLVTSAQSNSNIAANLCMKIQGLKLMHFFVTNDKNISTIMNKMINGAKKIGEENGFFIKIY